MPKDEVRGTWKYLYEVIQGHNNAILKTEGGS